MKIQDLPSVDGVAKRAVGVVVEVHQPDEVRNIPFWTEMGGGMVTLVQANGKAYMASRISHDWMIMIETPFEE